MDAAGAAASLGAAGSPPRNAFVGRLHGHTAGDLGGIKGVHEHYKHTELAT